MSNTLPARLVWLSRLSTWFVDLTCHVMTRDDMTQKIPRLVGCFYQAQGKVG